MVATHIDDLILISVDDHIIEPPICSSAIAVRRAGDSSDIANAISFFVDERSSFVSGQVLYVAGGPIG